MRFAPIYERASEKHPDIIFAKVDTEAEQVLAAEFDIRSIPTIMAVRDGVIVFSQPGALPEPALESLISQVRALDMDDVARATSPPTSTKPRRTRGQPAGWTICSYACSNRSRCGGSNSVRRALTIPSSTTRRERRHSLPLALPEAVVRTFDTPGFAGMTFYEVRAKSIINRVPGASRVPFEWTINPYRGCSHACVYCLAGDTPILMADGRTKRAGRAARRRPRLRHRPGRRLPALRRDQVLAHWSTVKPAYRVTLADGTELVASGDHRFLTDRGWRHVTGSCRRARSSGPT